MPLIVSPKYNLSKICVRWVLLFFREGYTSKCEAAEIWKLFKMLRNSIFICLPPKFPEKCDFLTIFFPKLSGKVFKSLGRIAISVVLKCILYAVNSICLPDTPY